jgi:hypothetical protein
MPIVKDRRRSLRVEIEGTARIRTDRDAFEGRCIDLGLHGLALRSSRAVRPGDRVSLEVLLHGQHLRLEAVLVRRQRHAGDYLLGLAFVDLDLDAQRRLEHAVFERLDGTPHAELMRAFVAHADRVPPTAARDDAGDRTMVSGEVLVPVISGHTQVVSLDHVLVLDRTVIAPPPPRLDTVLAPVLGARAPASSGIPEEVAPEDDLDTAQFRLREAAQAEQARGAPERLAPDAPVPEDTVMVGALSLPLPIDRTEAIPLDDDPPSGERTLVTFDALPREAPRERTLVTSDAPAPPRERTLVTSDAPAPPREHTLVTSDAPAPPRERTLVERTLAERTLPFLDERGTPEAIARTRTTTLPLAHEAGPRSSAEPPSVTVVERTLPFSSAARRSSPTTGNVTTPSQGTAPPQASARALLDAAALLRSHEASVRRGPRVIVAIPHRTQRRARAWPWTRR